MLRQSQHVQISPVDEFPSWWGDNDFLMAIDLGFDESGNEDILKFRDLISYLFENLERLEAEVLTFKTAFAALTVFDIFPELDQVLQKSRETCQPMVAKKHEEIRARVFGLLDQADMDQELRQLLATYKPKGPAN